MSETTEFSAFIEALCVECGNPQSIKIDSWLVGVRQQIVAAMELSPNAFVCASCGQLNQVRATLRFEIDSVLPAGDDMELNRVNIEVPRPTAVIDMKRKRRNG